MLLSLLKLLLGFVLIGHGFVHQCLVLVIPYTQLFSQRLQIFLVTLLLIEKVLVHLLDLLLQQIVLYDQLVDFVLLGVPFLQNKFQLVNNLLEQYPQDVDIVEPGVLEDL